MVSTRPPTSKSSLPFDNPLVTVPKAPITIGIIVTFTLHCFFHSLARSRYLSFFFHILSVLFCGQQGQQCWQFCKFSFFLWLINIRSCFLAEIRWSVCMSKSHRSLYVSFSRTGARLCIYHLFVWSNFNFLHISQWITLPIQSCLVLYSFCANWLHSLIMWLIVSSLSPHCLHLLFCRVLSILALIWLVLMALFYPAIRRDSVSLFKFPFLSQVQMYSLLFEFFTPAFADSLRDSKSPKVSRTFSILANLNNSVVWTVSIRSLISIPPVLVPIL